MNLSKLSFSDLYNMLQFQKVNMYQEIDNNKSDEIKIKNSYGDFFQELIDEMNKRISQLK